MQLSPKAIEDFKKIYREEYGEEISDDQAREMGTQLVRVFKVLLTVSPPSKQPDESPANSTALST